MLLTGTTVLLIMTGMNLRAYLKASSTTQADFAARVGVTQGTIAHWLAHRVVVPAEKCGAIVAASEGCIGLADLRPDLWPAPPAADPLRQPKIASPCAAA